MNLDFEEFIRYNTEKDRLNEFLKWCEYLIQKGYGSFLWSEKLCICSPEDKL